MYDDGDKNHDGDYHNNHDDDEDKNRDDDDDDNEDLLYNIMKLQFILFSYRHLTKKNVILA